MCGKILVTKLFYLTMNKKASRKLSLKKSPVCGARVAKTAGGSK